MHKFLARSGHGTIQIKFQPGIWGKILSKTISRQKISDTISLSEYFSQLPLRTRYFNCDYVVPKSFTIVIITEGVKWYYIEQFWIYKYDESLTCFTVTAAVSPFTIVVTFAIWSLTTRCLELGDIVEKRK